MDISKSYNFRQCVDCRDRSPGKWRYRDQLGNMPDENGTSLGPYKYLHERIEIPQSISPEIDQHDERKYSINMNEFWEKISENHFQRNNLSNKNMRAQFFIVR